MITFHVVPRGGSIPDSACNAVFLWTDHWNDYSFVTMFDVYAFDENGIRHDLNNVKIGFSGQTEEIATYSTLETPFKKLSETYFSVGTDVSYYQEICKFSENYRNSYLIGIRDVAFSKDAMSIALTESVFKTSHLRSLSVNTIEQQFRRVLDGGVPVTDYDFRFTLDPGHKRAGYELNFQVRANSKPSTNVHAIIGRNGVGKTTLLNAMIRSITDVDNAHGRFEENKRWGGRNKIGSDYFSGVISISFSAFDPFSPPHEQADPTKGTCYFYVGLKSLADHDGVRLKSLNDLYAEFIESLEICLSEAGKRKRWLSAIALLETDDNFSEMGLSRLSELDGVLQKSEALSLQKRMSSGHAIVLLTITKIVARIEEKNVNFI